MLRCRAADGQPVNIPALPLRFIRVTKSSNLGILLDLCSCFLGEILKNGRSQNYGSGDPGECSSEKSS